jgi:N-methylhydantoinase B/oxoprolinase/acetone carboxylase alpha subunit
MVYDTSMPYPYPPDGAWITVRVPAEGLQSLVDQLSGLGEVTASTINRQDVTEVTLDLEARVTAAQASVDRLTQLMAQAGSVADLIAAEAALAERQATLESYQQQLKYYDDQVAMSTLTVTLTQPVETVEADPAGFGDGLAAGWNGLVATLNGIVIAVGFLIPWIAVLAVLGLIVWGIVRLVRRNRGAVTPAVSTTTPSATAAAAPRTSESDVQE